MVLLLLLGLLDKLGKGDLERFSSLLKVGSTVSGWARQYAQDEPFHSSPVQAVVFVLL